MVRQIRTKALRSQTGMPAKEVVAQDNPYQHFKAKIGELT